MILEGSDGVDGLVKFVIQAKGINLEKCIYAKRKDIFIA